MLTPEYLEDLPVNMVELYSQAEADILQDMARRISMVGEFTSTAQYQMARLEAMGASRNYILTKLSSLTQKTRQELEQLLTDAGVQSLEEDDANYRAAGKDPKPVKQSPKIRAVMEAGARSTMGLFQNLTRTTASAGQEQLIQAMDRAWAQISTGAFDYRTAIEIAIKNLAKSGLETVRYPSGHVDHLDVAVRRAVLTGVNQTGLKMQEARMEEMDWDLVEVSAHGGARNKGSGPANHESWQGKVYSRSGKSKKYPDFHKTTGYGTGEGLGGWNCRHHFHAFFPGSKTAYTPEELKAMEKKTVVYNGKEMTVYDATQKQRYCERQIRRYRREKAMLEAAGIDPLQSAQKLKKWQTQLKDFAKQTGLTRQLDREMTNKTKKTLSEKQIKRAVEKAYYLTVKPTLPKNNVPQSDTILQKPAVDNHNNPESASVLVPSKTKIEKVRIITGYGTSSHIRDRKRLSEQYGGDSWKWQKKGGIIDAKYNKYDIHWYEYEGQQYEQKVKGWKKK